jgi:3-hydroxyacyl-[acyl-carrier-protein] dehydratase
MRLEYFQMVDRIVALDPGARTIRAECLVPTESPVFEGHFPGHPILPGVLMIEAMVLAVLRFQRMPFLAQVKEAKLRSFVVPGQAMETEARLLHDGSGYAVVAASIGAEGRRVADAEITYRVVPFPKETLRAEMLATARRVAVPEAFLNG